MYSIKLQNIKKKLAFTLVELVIVIAIISLLAAVIVVAINPNSIFINGRNSTRSSDLNTLLNAFNRYIAESPLTSTRTLSDFNGYTNLLTDAIVSNAGANYTNGKCNNAVTTGINATVSGSYDINTTGTNYIDLSLLISNNYLPKVPQDPQGNPYQACIDTINNNQLVLFAPSTETLSNKISSFFPAMFEGAGTNLVTNPSVEINLVGQSYCQNATCTRSSEQAYSGSYSIKLVSTTTNAILTGQGGASEYTSVIPNTTYAASFYIYPLTDGINANVYLIEFQSNNTYITESSGSTKSSPINKWTKITRIFNTGINTGKVSIRPYWQANTIGQIAYFDAIQLEQRTTGTSYIDGSLLPSTQYGWTVPGSPHASTSYRLK